MLTKCLNQFHSKWPCKHDTVQVSTVVGLAFTQRSRHALHSVRQVRHLSLKIGRDAANNCERDAALKIFQISLQNYAYTFQSTKNDLSFCSIVPLDWIVVLSKTKHKNGFAYSDTLSSRFWPTQTDCTCHCTVAYRGGGVWGVQTLPPKFRRYRWSPRSHKQEEPASRFPFVVHCVLIGL